MRVWLPLTGTVREDGSGDPDDIVGPININLGDVAWRAVKFDYERGLVLVDLDAPPRRSSRTDWKGNPVFTETLAEYQLRRIVALDHVTDLLNKTEDELYAMSGSPKLKNKLKVEPAD